MSLLKHSYICVFLYTQLACIIKPCFFSEYTTDNLSSNSLIVVCGDRNKVINYNNIY